jgi:hypothetical protein
MRNILFVTFALLCSAGTAAFEMEMASVTVQDTSVVPSWTNVTFQQSFDTTPLVFALPTNQGSDPSTIRIRNISTTGFEILQVEPSANDGPHTAMTTAYLAIEPGDHLLPDGTRISAFEHTTASFANRFLTSTWDTVALPSPFSATPALLGSIQTTVNETLTPPATSSAPFMDVGIRNLGTTSVQVTLDRMESTAGGTPLLPERIALLAIDNLANLSFVDAFGSAVVLQSLATPRNIAGWSNGCFANAYGTAFTSTPLAVASANSRFGNNGGWVRRCSESSGNLGLTIDEDIDADSERNHTRETAGIVAASVAFHANLDVDLVVQKSIAPISDPVNGTTDPKAIPTATIGYLIDVENSGSLSPDNDTLVVTDNIHNDLSLCVTAACLSGGPVVFDDSASPVPPGVTIGAVDFSDDGGLTYSYVPVPDGDGYDAVVDAVRITLTGTMAAVTTSGTPSFRLRLAARVD